MALIDRYGYSNDATLRSRIKVALLDEVTTILRTSLASQSTDAEKKALRARQRWALGVVADPDTWATRAHMLIASTGDVPEAALASGLTDAQVETYTAVAINAMAAVELRVPEDSLPVGA